MGTSSATLKSTRNLLLKYLQTNDEAKLIKNFQNLASKYKENKLLNNLGGIMDKLNNWKIEEIQKLINQAVSGLNDNNNFKNILNIFKDQLIILLLDQIFRKTEDEQLKIQTLFNKIPILEEALQLSKEMNDEILIKKFLEKNVDNFTTLGLLSLYSANNESSIEFLGKSLNLLKESRIIFPKRHSFLLRILSNLFSKIHDFPELLKTSKIILNLDSTDQGGLQIASDYIKQAISIDQDANYSSGLALDHFNLALILYEQDQFKLATQEIKKAQLIHEKLRDNEGILNDLILLGIIIHKTEKKDKAIQIYQNALNIANESNLKHKIAELHLLLGMLLHKKQYYEESLNHLKNALFSFKQGSMYRLIDLIESYSWIGLSLRKTQKYEDTLTFMQKILHAEKGSDTILLMHIYSQICITYIHLNKQKEFRITYKNILLLYEKNKDEFQYSNIEYQIGIAFCNQKKFQEGLNHLGKAFQIYFKLQNEEKIKQLLHIFSLVYTKINKLDIAKEISSGKIDLIERSRIIFDKGGIPDLKMPEIIVISSKNSTSTQKVLKKSYKAEPGTFSASEHPT
ncbi:MAG: tetratricopeptide repeat protein [Promethearchaeota archaeon]